MTDPLADVVSTQYERWVYPEPIEDLPRWLESNWQWFDPSHAHRIFWPDREYPNGLDVLIAGCGANQAAVIAYTNPSAHVTAIDVSQSSLAHEEHLKSKYRLRNLELHRLPIEDVGTLGRDYDLIISTGVLHHMADPTMGMRALADQLRPDGVIALMLYARYGRIGVDILEGVFQDLDLRQDQESVEIVRSAISSLPPQHPLQGYLSVAPDLGFDAGLVDTFLHGRQRTYTVADCLDLVASSGLVFQDWFLKSPYEPMNGGGNAFLDAVAELPDATRWSVMERINTLNGCHFFTACRSDRPTETYRVDPTGPDAMHLIPVMRYQCRLEGTEIVRPGWRLPLDERQLAVVQRIDGATALADITGRDIDPEFVCSLVTSLWQHDFIAFITR